MNIARLPGTVIERSLAAGRLPVAVVARLSRQGHNEKWPPSLAYDGFEATVQSVLGSLLRDDSLLEKGRLRQAKVAQLRKAADLETLADARRDEARDTYRERRETAEEKRQQAAQRAQQRKQNVESQTEQRKNQVAKKAAAKKTAAREVKAAQDEAISRQERVAKGKALKAEQDALEAQQEALDKEMTVDVIDATLEGTKEARSTG